MQACRGRDFIDFRRPSHALGLRQTARVVGRHIHLASTPSEARLDRVDADDVTSPLHIVLRLPRLERANAVGRPCAGRSSWRLERRHEGHCWASCRRPTPWAASRDIHWPRRLDRIVPTSRWGPWRRIICFAAPKGGAGPSGGASIGKAISSHVAGLAADHVHGKGSIATTDEILTCAPAPLWCTAPSGPSIKESHLSS